MSNELTPMMKQYMQTKEEYKDCIGHRCAESRTMQLTVI